MELEDLATREKRVLTFLYEWGRPIRVGDLRRHLSMPHSTLNSIVKRLKGSNLVDWTEYSNTELTGHGKQIAAHLLKHHIIIHHFLVNTLHLSDTKAHEESTKIAGTLSCTTVEQMKSFNTNCNLEVCRVEVPENIQVSHDIVDC